KPAGYPVTLQLGGAQKLTVTTGRLLGPDGQEVPSYTLNPGSQVTATQWSLIPHSPLKPGARYTAEVVGTADGTDFSNRWSSPVTGRRARSGAPPPKGQKKAGGRRGRSLPAGPDAARA